MNIKRLPFLVFLMFFGAGTGFSQTITQTNLPIVIITTTNTIGSTEVGADMDIISNSAGLNHPGDAPAYSGPVGIRHRGSSSNPKKSFNIETWDDPFGSNSLNVPLLGMPSENDWVLLACYTDRSLMRDLIGFHIYESMGGWAPRMRLVEVILNNNYQGVYLFGERIKRDVNRLDIATLNNIDNNGEELTGGYIFKIDNSSDDSWTSQYAPPYASGSQNIKFHYDEPNDGDITMIQKAYIQSYVDSFEDAMNSTDFQDTVTGWRRFGAQNNWQEYLVFSEVMKNADAYRLAHYMYKDKGKKLRNGPPWDMELTLYNTANCNASKDTGWAYNFGTACGSETYLPPFWWGKLATDTFFMREAKCRYTMYRSSFLDTNQLWGFVDSVSAMLNAEDAQDRNFQKWPIWGTQLVNEPMPVSANYGEEVGKIKEFLRKRFTYLDAQWLTPGCTLSIGDVGGSVSGVNVFPNPVADELQVRVELDRNAEVSISVQDMYGRTVMQSAFGKMPAGTQVFRFGTGQLAKGVYILTTTVNGSERIATKVVKQ